MYNRLVLPSLFVLIPCAALGQNATVRLPASPAARTSMGGAASVGAYISPMLPVTGAPVAPTWTQSASAVTGISPVLAPAAAPVQALVGIDAPKAAITAIPDSQERGLADAAVLNAPAVEQGSQAKMDLDIVAKALDAGVVYDGSGKRSMSKPDVDSWTVGKTTYKSTRELLEKLPVSEKPIKASFRFYSVEKKEPSRPIVNGASGLVIGGVGMGIVALFVGAAFSQVGSFVNTFVFPSYNSGPGAGVSLLAGITAIGAIFGVREFIRSDAPKRIDVGGSGTISRVPGPNGDRLYFTRLDDTLKGEVIVDLGAFADAAPVSAPAAPTAWPKWKSALAGLGAGAALGVSFATPILQFAAFFVGTNFISKVLATRTRGTGVNGTAIGIALGMIAAVVVYPAIAFGGWVIGAGAYVAGTALVGAVVGLIAANAYRAERARVARNAREWWSER